jgi:hypothetical protein
MHVHVVAPEGEAKFWIQPIISLANYTGFNQRQLRRLQQLVEEHRSEIVKAWKDHFRL